MQVMIEGWFLIRVCWVWCLDFLGWDFECHVEAVSLWSVLLSVSSVLYTLFMEIVCWTFFLKFYHWNYRVPSMSDSSFVGPVPLLSTKRSKKAIKLPVYFSIIDEKRYFTVSYISHVKDYANIFQVNDLFSKGNNSSSSHLFYLIKIICKGQGQQNKGNDLWHQKDCTLTEDVYIWWSNYFYRPLVYLSCWSIWQEKRWDIGLNPKTY